MKSEDVSLFLGGILSAAVLTFSLVPDVGHGLNSGTEKHLAAYCALSLLYGHWAGRHLRVLPYLLAALTVGAFGATIELIQTLIPYRNGNIFDGATNFCGALIGMILLMIARSRARAPSR